MPFVLDASAALRWHFEDEFSRSAMDIALRANDDGIVVPTYWQFETANGLVRGLREGRTSPEDVSTFIERLDDLTVDEHGFAQGEAFATVMPFAMEHGLKMFDAGYLALAKRLGIPLATFDRKLADAARLEGVEVMGLV
jgi:predicted nucleic acid-binding protein